MGRYLYWEARFSATCHGRRICILLYLKLGVGLDSLRCKRVREIADVLCSIIEYGKSGTGCSDVILISLVVSCRGLIGDPRPLPT